MKNKNKYLISIALSVVFVATTNSSAVNRILKAPVKTVSNVSFPDSISCDVKPHYRFRTDGKAGREVIVQFKGKKFLGKASFLVDCNGLTETTVLEAKDSLSQYSLLLPVEAGVKSDCQAKISLLSGQNKLQKNVLVTAMRQWTVYVYPHSHVDIGYTNTQANVEIIHKRNLINGIELAKKTANYPKDSRYLWNPEVLWPVERYLNTATPEQRSNIVDAVQKGYLHLDAGYIHANTSSSADEELFEYFRHC
jgi:alpha-mannosidase